MKKNFIRGIMKKAAWHLALGLAAMLVAGSLAEPAAAALTQEAVVYEAALREGARAKSVESVESVESAAADGDLFQEAGDQSQTCVLTLDAGINGWFSGDYTSTGNQAQIVEVEVLRGKPCAELMSLLPVPETDWNRDLRFAGWSLDPEAERPEEWLVMPEEGLLVPEEGLTLPGEGVSAGFVGDSAGYGQAEGTVTENLVLYAVWEGISSDQYPSGGTAGDQGAGGEDLNGDAGGDQIIRGGYPEGDSESYSGGYPDGDEEAAAARISAQEASAQDTSAGEVFGQDVSAQDVSAQEASDQGVSAQEASDQGASDQGASAQEASAQEASAQDVSAQEASGQEASAGGSFAKASAAGDPAAQEEVLADGNFAEEISTGSKAWSGRNSKDEKDKDNKDNDDKDNDDKDKDDIEKSDKWKDDDDDEEPEPEICTITFDANGGSYGRHHASTFREEFEKGEEIDLDDYRPHRYGSSGFLGWSLTPGGALLPAGDYIVQESVTLYACWKKELWDAEISLAKTSVVYTGKAQTPAVTVVYEGKTLKKDTDYTVQYGSNKNAGTATVRVRGKGAYTGTVKLTFQITRAAQKLTVKSAAARVAVGKKTTVKVSGTRESPKYTWKSSNTSVATVSSSGKVTAKKVGTARITVRAAATKNYSAVSASVTVRVVPAATKKLTAKNEKTGIRLTWKQVTGANGYYIYRDGKKITTIGKGTTVSYLDKGAAIKNRKYTYKLVAKASTGTSTLARTVKVRRKVPKSSGSGTSSSSSGSSGETGSGTSAGTSSGTSTGSDGGASASAPLVQTGLRYCFESQYVARTLSSSARGDLAVIDMDGISQSVISAATARGVKVYGYLNAGALEQERSYYNTYRNLRIAGYDGWEGEYWVDVTDKTWTAHLVAEAKKMKAAGASGLYLDNTDILYMVQTGFAEENTKMIRTAPTAAQVYKALRDVVITIQNSVGITVMPNGGDLFVRQFVQENPGVLKEVNQEGVLYDNNRAQPTSERRYYTEYLDWCRDRGLLIRGIEYINTAAGAQKCLEYYQEHGWQGLYVSRHRNLEGD